ncbi:unnamed protein product, partial [Meganyctiphanes norvegica]
MDSGGWGYIFGYSSSILNFLPFSSFLGNPNGGLSKAPVRWCTVSPQEQEKCNALAEAIVTDYQDFIDTYTSLECIQRQNHDECMVLLDQSRGDVVSLDSNEIFIAGRYHSLVPIMKELYDKGRQFYYSVAVIKKGTLEHVHTLRDLKGTIACFPSVASMGGWVLPIAKLIKEKAMDIIDCNNHIQSASAFFKGGCAVNILTDKHNPLGDNSQVLCNACGSELPGIHCTSRDKYAGYEGSFNCLLDKGEIAFLKHNTVAYAVNSTSIKEKGYVAEDFELLCVDGSRASLSEYESCNWGEVPANAIATSTAKSHEQREILQEFLKKILELYGKKSSDPQKFYLFDTEKYSISYDLLLSDDTKVLIEIPSIQQNFLTYLKGGVMNAIETIRSCPVPKMIMCVNSPAEFSKCLMMRTAMQAQLLKPEMECINRGSNFACMASIAEGEADVAVFEAGDIYTAGLKYNLVPFMGERYNLETLDFYVVAVSKEDDPDTDVLYLKGRNTCHPGVMHGAGWVIPMAYLIHNNLIRAYGCNSLRAASEYFTKACVPGALSNFYRHGSGGTGMSNLNLCHLCYGSGPNYCARNHMEPFYGFSGAFRCLVEGGGDVAFLKHTTVSENVDGRRKEWWARNQLTSDYQLLCRDGTRKPISQYKECNLGKVASNAIVTRGGRNYNDSEVEAYSNLFMYAQQYYGRDSDDDWNFRMFHSDEPYADLIFQDMTQQLVNLPFEKQHYHPYLGQEFLNARYLVDCEASATTVHLSFLAAFLVVIVRALS